MSCRTDVAALHIPWREQLALMEVGCVAGLRIASDFPLQGLLDTPRPDHAPPDVDQSSIFVRRVGGDELERRAAADPGAIAFRPGEPGSFLITTDNEVLVAPTKGAAVRSILSFLFGPCLGLIAYRNGLVPLHASAIEVPDGCVCFVGQSGAGKSTVVAALNLRGFLIHSDDVCMLRNTADGDRLAWPGIRWIRLTENSVRALGYAPAEPRIAERKHTFELAPSAFSVAPRVLRAVYVLEEASATEPASVVQIQGARAAERIIANVYRPNLAQRAGAWHALVGECVGIANRVQVFRFRRPLDFTKLTQSLDVLSAHLIAPARIPEPA